MYSSLLDHTICRYGRQGPDYSQACTVEATYVVLLPPDAAKPTPTPVWMPREPRTRAKQRRRRTPEYCRVHAYQVALTYAAQYPT